MAPGRTSTFAERAMLPFYTLPLEQVVLPAVRARPGPARVLEIGCGRAPLADGFIEAGCVWTGIDIDAGALGAITRGRPGLHVVRGDAGALPAASESIDVVLSISVLQYVDWRVVMRECERALRPGGRAFFIENLRMNPFVAMYRLARRAARAVPRSRFFGRIAQGQPPLHHLDRGDMGEIERVFSRARMVGYHLATPLALAWPLLRPSWNERTYQSYARSVRRVADQEQRLLTRFPRLSRYCWIAVIEVQK